MDGAKLTRLVLDALDEKDLSDNFADQRRIYENLDWAAEIFCSETHILRTSVDITTIADQQAYDLPPDFIELYMKNNSGRNYLKYTYDTDEVCWVYRRSYEKIFKADYTESQETPNAFAIIEKEVKEDLIEGTATSIGAVSGGECILTDTAALFLTTNKVYPRDIIHNITDGSDGYVISITDETHLVCALFDGTDNDFTVDDVYKIQPAAERQVMFEAPSETADHVLTVPYICTPSPVYSDFGFWRLRPRSCRAIAWGAGSLFKVPKRQFKESAELGGHFAAEVDRVRQIQAKKILNESYGHRGRRG